MSGHNKWSKIKHKKAATDAKKSKIFSKYARLITVESKKAKGDVNSPSLKAVIENAKKENMPQDNIARAVQKGAGEGGAEMIEVSYEAYGPGGSAIIIEGITDNKNRTGAEIKHLLSKSSIELATPGSASWAFEKDGLSWKAKTITPISEEDKEKLETLVENLLDQDDVQEVYTNVN
ncbi:MAG: YebC/PmpR family DNA-binding transcriptional regulator [Candidatus Pacebacteria bacterium]|jgi:YebC/PmpR family DNA-binding regulatory protein|nr:YebC/PmpR family DNA-binding transcriptional regulator [Candidatus Paceibacterota bacterium]